VPPGLYTIYTRQMDKFEIVDPLTLRIHTSTPAPLLPLDVAALPILSKKAASGPAPEGKTSAELNAGNGLVGTGPFKFVSWQRGNSLVLERNDAYWDGKAPWAKVILRPLSNNTARVPHCCRRRRPDGRAADHRSRCSSPISRSRWRAPFQPPDLHSSRPAWRSADRHSGYQRQN
jgi:hypothetical protein